MVCGLDFKSPKIDCHWNSAALCAFVVATLVIMAVRSQQQGHSNLANLRRIVHNTSDDSVVVHLLAALREDPTGVNDQHTSSIMKKIRKGNAIQFRQMFRVSRLVFEAVLAELSPFLNDGTS